MIDSKLSCRVTIINSMPKMAARMLIGFYSILFVDIERAGGYAEVSNCLPRRLLSTF
jgi:hypothetical protein